LCKHVVADPEALRWARFFERRLLPDEYFLPTGTTLGWTAS